jgi:hypothetical protein
MYDYPDDEVQLVGWEPFVTRQWELIFAGYMRGVGIRRSGRRWADLLVGGADMSPDVADQLVRAAVVDRPDVAPEDALGPDQIRDRMLAVLDLMCAEQANAAPGGSDADRLAELARFLRDFALGDPI